MINAKSGVFSGGSRLLTRGTLDQARLTWRLVKDPRVSIVRYAIPALVLAYLVSPVDAIPDLLLGIGQTDDLGVAVLAFMPIIRFVPKLAPAHVVDDHLHDMGLGGESVIERDPNPAMRSKPNLTSGADRKLREDL